MSEISEKGHTMQLEERQLDDLVPYWRNPRQITDEAVDAVAESIKQYGYQQPIAVTPDNVIVIGHTRYAALRRLKVSTVPVVVLSELTASQAKQLRVLDNRTSELTAWDLDSLTAEIEGLDQRLMATFFADMMSMDDQQFEVTTTEDDAELPWMVEEAAPEVDVACPNCFHMWEQPVTKADVFAGRLTPVTLTEAEENAG